MENARQLRGPQAASLPDLLEDKEEEEKKKKNLQKKGCPLPSITGSPGPGDMQGSQLTEAPGPPGEGDAGERQPTVHSHVPHTLLCCVFQMGTRALRGWANHPLAPSCQQGAQLGSEATAALSPNLRPSRLPARRALELLPQTLPEREEERSGPPGTFPRVSPPDVFLQPPFSVFGNCTPDSRAPAVSPVLISNR